MSRRQAAFPSLNPVKEEDLLTFPTKPTKVLPPKPLPKAPSKPLPNKPLPPKPPKTTTHHPSKPTPPPKPTRQSKPLPEIPH